MNDEQKAMIVDLALILWRLLCGEADADDPDICRNIAVRLTEERSGEQVPSQ